MKLEDCKPGVRVRVYFRMDTPTSGEIVEVGLRMVTVKLDQNVLVFWPQQLRKLVKRKRPEIKFAFHNDGTWIGMVMNDDRVQELKSLGREVWVMVGKKRL